MKKTLLAAALIAGFAGVANAETSVTLYGIVDTGIAYDQHKWKEGDVKFKETRTGLKDGGLNGNRWGLKGSEDLGNGLSANFRLESGFNLSNGEQGQGGRLFGRWATIGLSGADWGSIDFGRQENVASRFFVDAYGTGNWETGAIKAFGDNVDGFRLDNSIAYVTPSFEGFQAAVAYSFNADGDQKAKLKDDKDQNNSGWSAGLRYANGPIEAAATYDRVRLGDGSAPKAIVGYGAVEADANGFFVVGTKPVYEYSKFKHASAWTLSGAYDFEVVKLSLAFGQSFDGFHGLEYNKKYDVNSYAVSLAAPVGDGTLAGTYNLAQARKELKKEVKLEEGKNKQHNFGLTYSYPLSKRTTVYAIGGYTKNVDFEKNSKRTVVGAGLRHAF